jgi:hypothetical protein
VQVIPKDATYLDPLTTFSQCAKGTGKSTLSHALLASTTHATRLSIDALIYAAHGLYAIDYPPSAYDGHQASAEELFEASLRSLLLGCDARGRVEEGDGGEDGKQRVAIERGEESSQDAEVGLIILDRSFYARRDRERYRVMIEAAGARCVLVYLRAVGGKEWLWERIQRRWAGRGEVEGERRGDVNFEVRRDVFEAWWDGFEVPDGENEVVVDV